MKLLSRLVWAFDASAQSGSLTSLGEISMNKIVAINQSESLCSNIFRMVHFGGTVGTLNVCVYTVFNQSCRPADAGTTSFSAELT